MNRIALDIGTQFPAQGAVCHQIDRAAQQVFDVELRAEVAFGGRAPVEASEDIDIAVFIRPIAGEGTEQGKIGDAEALPEGRLCARSRARTSSLVNGGSLRIESRRTRAPRIYRPQ